MKVKGFDSVESLVLSYFESALSLSTKDVREKLAADGVQSSAGATRTMLPRLCAAGKLLRYGYAIYGRPDAPAPLRCHPSVYDWTAQALADAYPNAHTPNTLKARYNASFRARQSAAPFDSALTRLQNEGKALYNGRDRWEWIPAPAPLAK